MTEQPPSAAMELLSVILPSCGRAGICRLPPCACAESIDALIARRVSAETERWQNRDRQRLEQIDRLQETVESLQSARAERPAPEGPQPHDYNGLICKNCGQKYGSLASTFCPAAALASTGEQPVPSRRLTQGEADILDEALMASVTVIDDGASTAAVVDYTERALTVARDAVEGVPSHLLPYRINSEEIAQAIAPDIAAALSAVASEHQGHTIASLHDELEQIHEELIQARRERDGIRAALLARLQEPDVREAVSDAIARVPNYGNAYVQNLNRADAALTKIEEMLK